VRQRREKVHGPYRKGDRWRLIVVSAVGARRTLSFTSEAEAVEKQAALLDAIAEIIQAPSRTVALAVAGYLAHLTTDGRAPGTIETAGHRLRGLLRGCLDHPLADLTPALAKKLYEQRVASGAKPDTHQGELVVARQLLAWCIEQGWLPKSPNPFGDVKPRGRKRAGRSKAQLRVTEGRMLMDFLLARLAIQITPELVAVLTAILLGPRAHEVVERDVRDLDDDGHLLWIPDSKSDTGRRMLEVPALLRPFLVALAGDRGGNQPLFIATDSPNAKRKRGTRRATRFWLYYHCKLICKLANVPTMTPQALRRTHSSVARRGGATGEVVAAQLGQKSIAVQERSYVAPGAAEAGMAQRVLHVLQGGKR
jgi:integrase